jgi:hypothetical protein
MVFGASVLSQNQQGMNFFGGSEKSAKGSF